MIKLKSWHPSFLVAVGSAGGIVFAHYGILAILPLWIGMAVFTSTLPSAETKNEQT